MAASIISSVESEDGDVTEDLPNLGKASAQLRQNRKALIDSFRIASSTPTSSRPTSSYRRQSPAPYAIQKIVLERADELHSFASEALKKEDYQAAISYLNKAIVLDPDNAEFFIERGQAYLHFCDFQSAILNYRRACILQPEFEHHFKRLAFVYFLQGQTFFDEQKYEEALEYFSKAVELKPDSLGYHTRSIACLAALKRHGECLALVNKRLEIERDNADLFVMRARLHFIFRNDSLCYFDVIDALKLDSEHHVAKELLSKIKARSQTYKQQAMRYDLLGKQDESMTKISAAIDVDPSVPEFNLYRSALHRRTRDFNAAVDDLLLAMDKTKHDEDHPVYKDAQKQLLLNYNDFAVDCFKKGFYEEAIILLNKAIKSEKQEKKLYLNRGDCFYKTKELHFALSDYLQAFEIDQSDEVIKYRLASVYNDLGILEYQERRYTQAEEFFSVAISYNPKMSSFYVSRAKARYMLENRENAQVDVLSALHLNNNNKDVISLFTRLFPGNTTAEALTSSFGEMVGMALTAVISAVAEDASKDRFTTRPFSPKQVLPEINRSGKSKEMQLQSCMDGKELAINVIHGKKKVDDLVESVMHARQSLEYTGPRLDSKKVLGLPMPSWVDKKKSSTIGNKSTSPPFSHKKAVINQSTTDAASKKSNHITFLTAS